MALVILLILKKGINIFFEDCLLLMCGSAAVPLLARCERKNSTTRPLAKRLVTTRCSLGDFLRKTESFGSVWAKDCEENSEGRIE